MPQQPEARKQLPYGSSLRSGLLTQFLEKVVEFAFGGPLETVQLNLLGFGFIDLAGVAIGHHQGIVRGLVRRLQFYGMLE